MKKTLVVLFIICLLGFVVFLYRDTLLYYFPCDHPILYKLEPVDARFNISQDQFAQDVQQAVDIWDSGENKELFVEDPNAKLTISLVFDQRQQLTNQINNLDTQLQNEKNTLSPAMQSYKNQVHDFQQKMQTLNEQIDYWNSRGGAPADEYQKLTQQQTELQQESGKLNQLAKTLNQSTDVYNSDVTQLNQTVDSLDTTLQAKPEEGLYNPQDNTIVIYFNNGSNELIHTLAHELGHSLGMQHVQDNNAIMYYRTNNSISPTPDDIAELQRVCQKEFIIVPLRAYVHDMLTNIVNSIDMLQKQNQKSS